MEKNKKWRLASVIAISLILSGVLLSQATFTDSDATKAEKTEKLQQLIAQEKVESAKAESMPDDTLEEISKKVEQERTAKQIGHEIAQLRNELYPQDQRELFEANLLSVKSIMHTNKYYATMVNDPVHGEKYKKAYNILMQKFQILERIEKDYNEGAKPIEQLQQELDDLVNIKELEFGK